MKWNVSDGTSPEGPSAAATAAAKIIFWKIPPDRHIKDPEECRKVDIIEEEMEESQTRFARPL